MSQNETPKTRGFGPVALIVTGVVCFAGGYMVNDLTKAIGVGVPEMKHPTGAVPSGARDPDPVPAEAATPGAGAGESPASTPEKKDEPKSETPAGSAPVGGAGAPPPKG